MKLNIKNHPAILPTILITVAVISISSGCATTNYKSGYNHYQLGEAFLGANHPDPGKAKSEFKKAVKDSTLALKSDKSLIEAYVISGAAWVGLSNIPPADPSLRMKALKNLLIAYNYNINTESWVKPTADIALGKLYYQDGRDVKKTIKKMESKIKGTEADKKEFLGKLRLIERAFYGIALDFYNNAISKKDVPRGIKIEALENEILCSYELMGEDELKPLNPEDKKQQVTKIDELSKELRSLDIINPIANYFMGKNLSDSKDPNQQEIALKYLIFAKCVGFSGLPSVLGHLDEDAINHVLVNSIRGEMDYLSHMCGQNAKQKRWGK